MSCYAREHIPTIQMPLRPAVRSQRVIRLGMHVPGAGDPAGDSRKQLTRCTRKQKTRRRDAVPGRARLGGEVFRLRPQVVGGEAALPAYQVVGPAAEG